MPGFNTFNFQANETKNIATINIFGAIGCDNTYWGETNNEAYALCMAIKDLGNKHARLDVYIQSPGGSIASGLAIFNALRSITADVHTYNQGFVGSMASIILLAPTKKENIHQPKTAIFHLHRAISGQYGNVNDLQEAISHLLVFEDVIQTAISELTGMKKEEIISKWFDGKEHFFSGTDAVSLGFGTIHEQEVKVQPVAQLQAMNYTEIMAMFGRTTPAPEKKTSPFENIFSMFRNVSSTPPPNPSNNQNSNPMFKITNMFVAALLVAFELKLDAGFVHVPEPKMKALIDETARAAKAEKDLTTENVAQKEQIEALTAQLAALGKKPADPATPPAGGTDTSNSGGDELASMTAHEKALYAEALADL